MTNWQRQYFLMRGWARFLSRESEMKSLMDRIKRERGKYLNIVDGNWGILVKDDYWALHYQRLNFRICRAHRAVQKDVARCYNFTGDGPLTMNIVGASIPGWEDDPDEIAIPRAAKQFDERYRQKAMRAKKILAGEESLSERLGRIDEQEAIAEAMGHY